MTSFNYAYDIEPEEPIWWQKLAFYMETVDFQIILNFSHENFIAVFFMSKSFPAHRFYAKFFDYQLPVTHFLCRFFLAKVGI